MFNWLHNIFCRYEMTIPESSGWMANAILDCLRGWQRQHGPGPFVLTTGDIEHLAAYAADLQRLRRETKEWALSNGFSVRETPERIHRG